MRLQYACLLQKEAYFLSRLPKSCGVYLEPDAEAVNIAGLIDYHYPHQAVISLEVYLGKEKFPCRLVAYRLPELVVNKRRRKAYQAARKKSRKPTKEYLSWLRFSFYVTNVPLSIWATEVIGTIYRLRWQIELIFKQTKSLLRIDCLCGDIHSSPSANGTSPYRIKCFIYGRLCVVCLISMLYSTVFWHAWETDLGEVSRDKLIKWLLRKNRLAQVIRHYSLFLLFDELLSQLPKRLLKQKRKRKTTLERIVDQETFQQAFSSHEDEGLQEAA